MAPFSEGPAIPRDPIGSEHVLPPTAPALDLPTNNLPEKPTVTDAALREHANALSRQWEMLPLDPNQTGISQRLTTLKTRLSDLLRLCRKTASIQELTPELELLESTRMLEAALIAGDNTARTFASLPRIRIGGGDLPRTVNLAEGYLSAAGGIWSPESLTIYVQHAQQYDALLLAEITVLPQALKLAQLEYILDRAEEAFAAGPLPPIEQSPFSAILHSMRRLNQLAGDPEIVAELEERFGAGKTLRSQLEEKSIFIDGFDDAARTRGSFQHQHILTGFLECVRAGEAGNACADDDGERRGGHGSERFRK